MIMNLSCDLATKQVVWAVKNPETGAYVQCVPAYKVPEVMAKLQVR